MNVEIFRKLFTFCSEQYGICSLKMANKSDFLKLSNYSQIAFSNRKLKNHKITCIHYLY